MMNKQVLRLNPQRMYIKKNDTGDYSIKTSVGNTIIEVCRYKDEDDDYMLNRIKEILEYIQN